MTNASGGSRTRVSRKWTRNMILSTEALGTVPMLKVRFWCPQFIRTEESRVQNENQNAGCTAADDSSFYHTTQCNDISDVYANNKKLQYVRVPSIHSLGPDRMTVVWTESAKRQMELSAVYIRRDRGINIERLSVFQYGGINDSTGRITVPTRRINDAGIGGSRVHMHPQRAAERRVRNTGTGNPAIQLNAVEYVAMSRTAAMGILTSHSGGQYA
ncbi:hypothetical protein C8R44DRAFT_732024 [Mycena epipterygia]|nr:hypothetical protein C8R44DRAFT_732024 [Mycena epipterygia]